MDLQSYLDKKKDTPVTLAERLGVRRTDVYRWAAGTVWPRPAQLAAIIASTGGKVTADAMLKRYMQNRGPAEAVPPSVIARRTARR